MSVVIKNGVSVATPIEGVIDETIIKDTRQASHDSEHNQERQSK